MSDMDEKMTDKEKELLLKDLCGRLPYGVKIEGFTLPCVILDAEWYMFMMNHPGFSIRRPYLRKMGDMTDAERAECRDWIMLSSDYMGNRYFNGFGNISAADTLRAIDFLNSHHFDYRNLIEKDLALVAPEDMYRF